VDTKSRSVAFGTGVSTHREAIRVVWESRTVRFRSENPQGFGIDERRYVINGVQVIEHGLYR
jgi:hypothetical protein